MPKAEKAIMPVALSPEELKNVNTKLKKIIKVPKTLKLFLRSHIKVWSEGEETSRVLALMNLAKSVRLQSELFETLIKKMYKAYIVNTKHVNPGNLATIRFMQRSFVELLSLNLGQAYKQAFLYLRQLAITLRKAIILPTSGEKGKVFQTVYNWQFVCCLQLWCQFVSLFSARDENVKSLRLPLIQLLTGTIKLRPATRYLPLRFHCCRMLNCLSGLASPVDQISSETDTSDPNKVIQRDRVLTPALHYLLEVFQLVDFNKRPALQPKKPKKKMRRSFGGRGGGGGGGGSSNLLDTKPLQFHLMLYCSVSQMQGPSFLEAVSDYLYQAFVETVVVHCRSVAFPEWSLELVAVLKQFTSKCSNKLYNAPMKNLHKIITENADYIRDQRRNAACSLADASAVEQFEAGLEPPFLKSYAEYKKARSEELKRFTEFSKHNNDDEAEEENGVDEADSD